MKFVTSTFVVLATAAVLVSNASAFVAPNHYAMASVSALASAPSALFMSSEAEASTPTPSETTPPPPSEEKTPPAAAATPATTTSQNKQALYGDSLEMPSTYVRCGRCQTVYAMKEDDLGQGKGIRLECTVCSHSWFQSRERVMDLRDGYETVTLPEKDKARVALNLSENKPANFMGDIKLYVGNISFECDEVAIHDLFADLGVVGDVSLVKDDIGRNRGFGFVTMRKKEDGLAAIEKLDGKDVNGRNIAVRESTN